MAELTEAENRSLELCSDWWNSLHQLDLNEQDRREFLVLFHAIQDKILARPQRRQRTEKMNVLLRKVVNEKRKAMEAKR